MKYIALELALGTLGAIVVFLGSGGGNAAEAPCDPIAVARSAQSPEDSASPHGPGGQPEEDRLGKFPFGRFPFGGEPQLLIRDAKREYLSIHQLLDDAFQQFDPEYLQHRDVHRARLDELRARLHSVEKSAHPLHCSEQIFIAAKILVEYSALWDRADAELDQLTKSLATENQEFADEQTADGSWGACVDNWVEHLDATVDALNARLDEGSSPATLRFPLSFLSRIDTPLALVDLLYGQQVSNVAASGVFNREGMGAIGESLAQLLLKPSLTKIAQDNGARFLDEVYQRAYVRFLDGTQEPTTGFWGPWLNVGADLYRLIDLSMTFHVISYRHGCVGRWREIIDTLFAIKSLPYPAGWLWRGKLNDHNDYDIVKILRYGWPYMTVAQKEQAKSEIQKMIAWTLANSFEANGTLKFDQSYYDSLPEAYYFTISFLDEVGFWRKKKRFWDLAHADFPNATDLCKELKSQVERPSVDTDGSAKQKIELNCP